RPHVRPEDIADSRRHRRLRGFEVYRASRLNRHVLAEVVGYLRDAQAYALATILLLATLTVIAAMTTATKAPTGNDAASPRPSPSAVVTPHQRPTSSPAVTSFRVFSSGPDRSHLCSGFSVDG